LSRVETGLSGCFDVVGWLIGEVDPRAWTT
jgi:hypothetical protein